MTTIIHRTNGLIDIQAFTLMGMSAKPFSNSPIGRFGTGLKYAIAVLVRNGARPVLWIGQDRYEFFSKPGKFRGKEFQRIRMKRLKFSVTKATSHDLPFTTDYGRDWHMWMAFRELEANTRDEDGGATFAAETEDEIAQYVDRWHTCLMIDHEDYAQVWRDRDTVFLPDAKVSKETGLDIQIMPGPAKNLYYRGMRAKDLGKDSIHTYNILGDVDLTEDRQIGSEYKVRAFLATAVTQSRDEAFIKEILTAGSDVWEHGLDFNQWGKAPTEEFLNVLQRVKQKTWSAAGSYYEHHRPRPVIVKQRVPNQFDLHPGPWTIDKDGDVHDTNDVQVLTKPVNFTGDWESFAETVIKRCGKAERPEPAQPALSFQSPTLTTGGAITKPVEAPVFDDDDIPF